MIFCTTGTQAPFDRFIKAIDEIAETLNEDFFVQAYKSKYTPKNIRVVDFVSPDEFAKIAYSARIIIAHAGIGSIISAMRLDKPLIIFPRVAKLGEHRNEHQLATAKKMSELGYAYIANDVDDLKRLIARNDLAPLHKMGDFASQSLIDEIRNVVECRASFAQKIK